MANTSMKYLWVILIGLSLVACSGSSDSQTPGTAGTGTAADSLAADTAGLVWQQANLTNYISYPDSGSDECVLYNGCEWAGWFAALDDQQTPEWVASHNIISVHENAFPSLKLKTLRLRQAGKTIDAVVYDECADSDCDGCCTENATANGLNFLIDMEVNTLSRFGGQDGIVEWTCLDC